MNLIKLNVLCVTGLICGVLTSSARAGCNCNVPPSPAPFSGFSGDPATWSVPAPQGMSPGGYTGTAYGDVMMNQYGYGGAGGGTWAPGGYEARVGSPAYYHDPAGGQYQMSGNPYEDHFGPGFHRSSLHGHYRFPYYNYRAPWYFPGRAVYNRDTNFAW